MSRSSCFTISLDFELFWGVLDIHSFSSYGSQILGGRIAIPHILNLFQRFDVHATWAIVGFLTFSNRSELFANLPDLRPEYLNHKLDPYLHLPLLGRDESDDPYHFGYSLVRKIEDTPGMEIASHSFSHFCCLEPRQNSQAYKSDLQASVNAFNRIGINPKSLVFCRNQYDSAHLNDAKLCGFNIFRGTDPASFYPSLPTSKENHFIRASRLADCYINLSGFNTYRPSRHTSGLINIPSSRFLRPYSFPPFEHIRLRRILTSMTFAAQNGFDYHLWWHPHNFGSNLNKNLVFLETILIHYRYLREVYSMKSLNFREVTLAL